MLKLDIARRQARWSDVSAALSEWGQEGALERGLASALVAERANDKERAATSYRAAYDALPASDVALRPLASLDPKLDLAAELAGTADALGVSFKGAITRIEATLRATNLDDATKKERLDHAHEAAPTLPIASFLAERYAPSSRQHRRRSSLRSRTAGPHERPDRSALDAIREALLVVDSDPALAATRLEEAHHARPDDFALRELYERLSVTPVTDRGTWREERAAKSTRRDESAFAPRSCLRLRTTRRRCIGASRCNGGEGCGANRHRIDRRRTRRDQHPDPSHVSPTNCSRAHAARASPKFAAKHTNVSPKSTESRAKISRARCFGIAPSSKIFRRTNPAFVTSSMRS